MSAVKAGAAYVELTTRNTQFLKGLKNAQRQLQDFGNSLQLIGSKAFGIGATAAVPMAASIAAFTSFDDAIRAVRAVTQATEVEFDQLRETAKRLGATTSFSASEVALLMTELGRAGFRPDQINEMTAAVMNLARATGTEAATASGIMAATIRQFGLTAEDATRVADGLTAAANKSFNTVESLGESLKYAAPVAADANMQLEDTLAILGTLGNMGIQGSDAGTALRRLLVLSGAEAKRFESAFGVSALDAAGNVRPLIDILGDVAEASKNLSSGARTAKFNEVFGMLGITAASAIGKSVANTRELRQELLAASGIADKTAKEMDAGIGGAFRILKSAAEGVAIAFGEAIEKPLKRGVEAISGILSAIIAWIGANQKAVKWIAATVLGIGVLGASMIAMGVAFATAGSVIGGVLATFSLASGILSAVGVVLAGLLSPLGIVTAAVVGLGAYLVYSTGIGAQALAWLSQRFDTLKSTVSTSIGAIGQALAAGNIAGAAKILWLTLKLEWVRGTSWLEGHWLKFRDSFLATTDTIAFEAARVLSNGWSMIEVAWVESLAFLADSWSIFTTTLSKTWYSTVGFIRKAWVRLKSLFDSDIDVAAEVERIDNETAAKTNAASNAMLNDIGNRDLARKQRLAEIEAGRAGRGGVLSTLESAAGRARQQEADDAMAGVTAELEQARKEWQSAIADVSASAMSDDPAAPNADSLLQNLKSSLNQSAQSMVNTKRSFESAGTFSGFSIRGLGAQGLSDRSLRAAEETAANTEKLIQVIQQHGLAYS